MMTYEDFGKRFEYDESKPLDKGSGGTVFVAIDTDNQNSQVALKIPELQFQNDAKYFLKDEIKQKNNTGKRYIANYLEFGDFVDKDGVTKDFIVMQYYRLGNLAKNTFSSQKEIEDFLLHVLEGINFIHTLEKPIQHRDLKPQNILVDSQLGEKIPKICDFGFSKERNHSGGFTENSGLNAAKTRKYASPEQLKKMPVLSDNTDLWSFGVIAFECFTGKLPFDPEWEEGKQYSENEMKKIHEPWQGLIRRCLTEDCYHRIGTANDCLRDLDAFLRKGQSEIPNDEQEKVIEEDEQKLKDEQINKQKEEKEKIEEEKQKIKDEEKRKTKSKRKWQIVLGIIFLVMILIVLGINLINDNILEPVDDPSETAIIDNTDIVNTEQVSEEEHDKPDITPPKQPDETPIREPSNGSNEPVISLQQNISSKTYSVGTYVGEFKDGYREGYNGKMYYTKRTRIDNTEYYAEEGDSLVGRWDNGHINHGTLYDKNGNVKETIFHGKEPNPFILK